jgi:UDP-N-acetylglucosamine 2-epimerase
MLKVMTVVGTRPEVIKLSRVIDKLDRHCSQILVHTGQNFAHELNQLLFEDLDIRRPDCVLNVGADSPAETIGKVIIALDQALVAHQPDALLLLGDTNSALCVIAAKRRKIPIFHLEAGNRCFDERVPEEVNRRIVDHVADVNMTYSDIARQYLLREGLPPDLVIKIGSPLREVLEHYSHKIEASEILSRLNLQPLHYLVVSLHREENVDSSKNLQTLVDVLIHLEKKYAEPVVVSTHPRTRRRLDELGLQAQGKLVWHKPFAFTDYVKLQLNARATLSDSGTITEEASILNFPALNVREVHERPEGFEEGAVMLVGLDCKRIDEALEVLASQPRGTQRLLRMVQDYEPENVSDKVLRILLSYVGYVRRRVWGIH